jgi:photosystem II stability/assembly factor-like uncharacterized protein
MCDRAAALLVASSLAAACGSPATSGPGSVTIEPVRHPARTFSLHALGDWRVSGTDAYPGKQDDIYFPSEAVGYYGNGSGNLYRTSDHGTTWTQVLSKPGTYWRALGFLDEKHGFAGNIGPDSFPGVTDATLLYRTDDAGATWKPVALPDAAGARGVCAIDILAVDAVNAGHRLHKQIVHVGGRVNGPAALFASDDAGAHWQRLPLPPEVAMILDVKFLDANTGFLFAGTDPDAAASHGLIEKTTDSGHTWKKVYESSRAYEIMWKGAFPSRKIGYATLQNYSGETAAQDPNAHVTAEPARFVVKTTDFGDTWRELPVTSDNAMQEFGIGFIDDLHGWIGAIPTGFETTDGGNTWRPAPGMPKAANKLRIVHEGETRARVWAIGVDVRYLDLAE